MRPRSSPVPQSCTPTLPSPQHAGTLRKGLALGARGHDGHLQDGDLTTELSNCPQKTPRLFIVPLPSVPLWDFLKRRGGDITHGYFLLPVSLWSCQCCLFRAASVLNHKITTKNKCLRVAKAARGVVGGDRPRWQRVPAQIPVPGVSVVTACKIASLLPDLPWRTFLPLSPLSQVRVPPKCLKSKMTAVDMPTKGVGKEGMSPVAPVPPWLAEE